MMRSSASSLSPVPLQGKTLGVSEEEKVHFACWEECELLSHRVHRERSYFPKNNFNNNSHSTCSSRICCSSSRSRVYFPFPWNWACLYHRLSYWVLVEVMLCDFQSQAMEGDAASAWLPLSTLAFRIQLLGRKPRSLIMKWLGWRGRDASSSQLRLSSQLTVSTCHRVSEPSWDLILLPSIESSHLMPHGAEASLLHRVLQILQQIKWFYQALFVLSN